ncbi:hypothetical protein RZN05_11655 [Sphingomonas sp. HF-S4]|uniref:Lipoprotein n=1 Tax=Sphingomonas agrestis TaxID=3080540 RepID=A0ABU3Y901_9SPHN|nr:hypothetical protein [Sphingomonas sp. HF-S4]MDV3457642.1 hypothetical protein [Sphingomonas sp. HF-S4]
MLALTGCDDIGPPPPELMYEGLPVQGDWQTAQRAGFTKCIEYGRGLRCRAKAVMLKGRGPFQAAVDLLGKDARGGFRELTLWHDSDHRAALSVGDLLETQGWKLCRTGQEDRGDQEIYTKAGSPVRISIDISYFGKRRLRVLPERSQATGRCW